MNPLQFFQETIFSGSNDIKEKLENISTCYFQETKDFVEQLSDALDKNDQVLITRMLGDEENVFKNKEVPKRNDMYFGRVPLQVLDQNVNKKFNEQIKRNHMRRTMNVKKKLFVDDKMDGEEPWINKENIDIHDTLVEINQFGNKKDVMIEESFNDRNGIEETKRDSEKKRY